MLGMGWGLLTFACTCKPSCCYVGDGVGWGWGGVLPSFEAQMLPSEACEMEFTRKARGRKTHGTQCIDRKWSSLKKFIPKELASKRSNGGLNAQIQEYMYSFLWRCNNTV